MNRRDFLKVTCGALGTVVSSVAGWSRVQAASADTERPDAADAVWNTATEIISEFIVIGSQTGGWIDTHIDRQTWNDGFTLLHEWERDTDQHGTGMSVPFAVAGDGHFMLVDDDGTALHVYLPQVRT